MPFAIVPYQRAFLIVSTQASVILGFLLSRPFSSSSCTVSAFSISMYIRQISVPSSLARALGWLKTLLTTPDTTSPAVLRAMDRHYTLYHYKIPSISFDGTTTFPQLYVISICLHSLKQRHFGQIKQRALFSPLFDARCQFKWKLHYAADISVNPHRAKQKHDLNPSINAADFMTSSLGKRVKSNKNQP